MRFFSLTEAFISQKNVHYENYAVGTECVRAKRNDAAVGNRGTLEGKGCWRLLPELWQEDKMNW